MTLKPWAAEKLAAELESHASHLREAEDMVTDKTAAELRERREFIETIIGGLKNG